MKRIFFISLIMVLFSALSTKAQNPSDIIIVGTFDDLKLYEVAELDLNTGKSTPFAITGQMPNVSIVISADKATRSLDVFFSHNIEIKQLNDVIKITRFADIGNSIFFSCILDDRTEFSIQCQVNEGKAFIWYQGMDVASFKYKCNWNLLKNICNQWF